MEFDPNKKKLHSSSKGSFGFSHPLARAFFRRVLFVKKQSHPNKFWTESVVYAVLLLWGLSLFKRNSFDINQYGVMDSLLHNVHLVFHEAGHLIFKVFGDFINALGGTIMQCLIPVIVTAQFIRQKDNFPASVGLWWLSHSFLDVAPYIYDAKDRVLPLLGGGTGQSHPEGHDWYYILRRMDRLDSYQEIASFTVYLGKFILLLSLVWGAVLLYRQFLIQKAYGPKSHWEQE